MYQVIYNMLVTKDIGNIVFYYIDPWGKNPSIYSLGDKDLLSLHYGVHTRPSYICKRHDFQSYIIPLLASYNL